MALTPMQFEVLAVLAAQQGRAVHKHVIWDRVWHWPWETGPHGEALSGSAHTIRINILRLRRALGDCDARLIVTVVGYGYRLVGPEAS